MGDSIQAGYSLRSIFRECRVLLEDLASLTEEEFLRIGQGLQEFHERFRVISAGIDSGEGAHPAGAVRTDTTDISGDIAECVNSIVIHLQFHDIIRQDFKHLLDECVALESLPEAEQEHRCLYIRYASEQLLATADDFNAALKIIRSRLHDLSLHVFSMIGMSAGELYGEDTVASHAESVRVLMDIVDSMKVRISARETVEHNVQRLLGLLKQGETCTAGRDAGADSVRDRYRVRERIIDPLHSGTPGCGHEAFSAAAQQERNNGFEQFEEGRWQ